jgi:signal peptide peptidase SppA
MKLPQILSALTSEPQLIEPARAAALLEMFRLHSKLSAEDFATQRTGKGVCGDTIQLESMTIEDGIAFIPIGGPIGSGLSAFEKGAGAVDTADIARDLEEADENIEVDNIILLFDSPGGMVSGTPELADKISAITKPKYAFTNGGMIASAAYWLASACDGIFATKSADIGSIGVYAPFLDSSKAMEMQGLKVKVFSSGDFKGMGVPGTTFTEQQEEFLQNRISEIAEMFYDHVNATRNGSVSADDMQGQIFKADAALKKGFIDEVFGSEEEMVSFLK